MADKFCIICPRNGRFVKTGYAEARRLAEWNLELSEEIGDVIGSTLPLIVLGHAALALGEPEEASGYYQRCQKISKETGFHYSLQTATKYLAKVTLALGQLTAAEKHLLECLRITREIGFVRDIINLFRVINQD